MIVTAIEKQERRQRVNIFVDGDFAFSLSLAILAEAGLKAGDTLPPVLSTQLQEADARHMAYQRALRLLAYRPRSEKELRRRLKQKGVEERHVDATVEKLTGQGYLNDQEFAKSWVESRSLTSPRGRRLLTWELRSKGVSAELAADAALGSTDDEAAYRAAEKKARSFRAYDAMEFRRKMSDFLARRGFSWDVVRRTSDRIWLDLREEPLPDDDTLDRGEELG